MNIFFQKNLKSSSGFTLVELLIAIAIIVLLLGAAITYFPAYRNQQVLRQGSLDVNNSLRQTQTLAFAPDTDDAAYYVWEVKESDEDTGCLTDKYVSILPENGTDEDEQVVCLDDKVIIEGDIERLYFQVQTGKIFADAALTIPAYGEIQVKHSAMRDVGDYYYNIGIYNDSFDLMSFDVGQIRDLPGEPPTGQDDGQGEGEDEGGNLTDGGDNGGEEGGEYSECTDDGDCLSGCECVTSASQVNYCYCPPAEPVCGNDILESGEQCGDAGKQCPIGQQCQACKCIVTETQARCGDGKLNQSWEQCEKDGDCLEQEGESCVDCLCVTTQEPVRCGDGKIDPNTEQCEKDADCGANKKCNDQCQCVLKEYCGDKNCTGNETNQSCPSDCPVKCGDGYCNEAAGESYTSCDADCQAPAVDPRCENVSWCYSSTQCYGATCINFDCDCSKPFNSDLKADGQSCNTGSECQSGYCVFERCSANNFLCRYFPQWCS